MKLRLHVIVLSGLFFLIISSCKKEYNDKINLIPGDTIQVIGYTDITSFQVNEFSNDTAIKASLKGDTILVYWPSYKSMPATIKPTIILPDSATISPASGVEIPFKTGTTYKVISGAGTSRNYTLKVTFEQPIPWFYAPLLNTEFYNGSYQTLIKGDNFTPDTAMTKVYLVSAVDSVAYQAEIYSINSAGPGFFIPWNVPEGLYDIKVVNGLHTVYNNITQSRSNLQIKYPPFSQVYGFTVPETLHRSDTFEIRGFLLEAMTQARMYDNDLNRVNLEILSTSRDKVVLKVPADYPLNNYITIQLRTAEGISASDKLNINIVE